jgi:phosphonate transport system substrate-binding protein
MRILSLMLIMVGVLIAAGCGEDGDRLVVDFDKTVPVAQPEGQPSRPLPLRVAVAAMISPKETFDQYRRLLEYLSRRAGKDLEFIQRKTYAEINELIRRGDIDVAFICAGPYATAREALGFKPLAVPVVHGSPSYHSLLIVNKDSPYKRLEDLRGRTFAFTDPHSNTGKLIPTAWLADLQERPETFFSQTIYTYSHDNAILAVSRELVDGAAVDSLIYEYYQEKKPEFTAHIKIIRKSQPFGIPPLVSSGRVSPGDHERLQQVLLRMHQDPEGGKILKELFIDRFVPLQEAWYDAIRLKYQGLARIKEESHGVSNPQE